MTARDRDTLKTYYETGDIPTQVQFADFIDSCVNIVDDGTSAVTTGESFAAGEVSVNSRGSVLAMPTSTTNAFYGMRQKWNDASGGNSLYPVFVEPISSADLGGAPNAHGHWAIQLELTEFPAGYIDYICAIGVQGDGVTTETSQTVRETSYNIGGPKLTHEIYDKVQHVNGTYWPVVRRLGYTYITDQFPRDAASGVIEATVETDSFYVRSNDFANPDNPSIGSFGNYITAVPNFANGSLDFRLRAKVGGEYHLIMSDTSYRILTGRPVASEISTNSVGGTFWSQKADDVIIEEHTAAKHVHYCVPDSSAYNITGNHIVGLVASSQENIRSRHQGFQSSRYIDIGITGDNCSGFDLPAKTGYVTTWNPDQMVIGTWLSGSVKIQVANSTVVTFNTDSVKFEQPIVTANGTPSSASASGVAGTIVWDSSYLYVCTATNTWKRAALSSW